MKYNWQHPNWPNFTYDLSSVRKQLLTFAEKTGEVSGILKGLSNEMQQEAALQLMVTEAVKTSEIEGEYISREDVKSSIRNKLGLNKVAIQVQDKRATGISELAIDIRNQFHAPLTEEMLLNWHKMLMQGASGIEIGKWRTHSEPMQVVSGTPAKQTVHYEAPPSNRVKKEMGAFIKWFNSTSSGANELKPPLVRSAIAHLYFESIHPFEDGNGRIGRAISEKVLAQGIGRPEYISLSKTIEAQKQEYYAALERAQMSLQITPWIEYFVEMALHAREDAQVVVEYSLSLAKFFDKHRDTLSDRQLKVLRKMSAAGPEGFEGGMSPKKYISITGVSKATATRDLQELHNIEALIRKGDGRSTRYHLNL